MVLSSLAQMAVCCDLALCSRLLVWSSSSLFTFYFEFCNHTLNRIIEQLFLPINQKSVYDSLQVWFIHKWKKMIKVCLQVFLSMQVKQHFLSTKDFFFKKILMNKFIFMNIPWNERNRIKITQRECFSSKTSYIWNQSK